MYKNTNVIELVGKNFEKNKIKNTNDRSGILNVYAPWCIHCIKVSEMYKELSNLFLNKFNFYSLNSENKQNFKTIDKLNVKFFPSFYLVDKQGNIKEIKTEISKNKLICMAYKKFMIVIIVIS